MRVVIIGGVAAGMSGASQARRARPDAEILVLEKTQDVSYGACGLPYKLPPDTDMDDLLVISAQRFREERNIDVRLGHEVLRIDPSRREVGGRNAEGDFVLGYDKLIICTGARVWAPPIKGLDALWGQGAYPLKTIDDGRTIKAAMAADPPKRVVVIGAGYIGLEATENFREMGAEVTVVEALPEILPWLPETLRVRVLEEANARGVEMLPGTRVEAIERVGSGIAVETSGARLEADLVLVATGVRPEAELAAAAGLALGAAGAIAVDAYLRTSDEHIYAAGDCADAIHAITRESVWFPLALRANRAGKLAGDNVFGLKRPAPPVLGTAVFKFFGLEVARTGLSSEEADAAGLDTATAEIVGSTRAGYYPGGGKLSVWLIGERKTRKLLGCCMVGPEAAAHKIDTAAAAIHAGMTAEQIYDMDLAYAPPFGPSWSPLLIAASQLSKALD
ncbi:putative Coenzyme A disulfide reductase [Thiocapsa sp. KS1]|nr:FAD-dependent oxidoreductase [Thiocapsa sp. KS1]CRI63307.1 putative Coenzyme A disulfide reductase [Thiocapsa sp. KS1]